MSELDERPWLRPEACVRDGDEYVVQTPHGVYRLRLGERLWHSHLAGWDVVAPSGEVVDNALALHTAARRAWEHAEVPRSADASDRLRDEMDRAGVAEEER